jgi:nucleoside-diphosphate-sugar epimerase
VRVYLGDSTRLYGLTDWRPQRDAETIIADIAAWIRDHEQLVVGALA